MAKYVCEMNRLDYQGNSGASIRRGEQFEIKDKKRAKSLLDMGYISKIPVSENAVVSKPEGPVINPTGEIDLKHMAEVDKV